MPGYSPTVDSKQDLTSHGDGVLCDEMADAPSERLGPFGTIGDEAKTLRSGTTPGSSTGPLPIIVVCTTTL